MIICINIYNYNQLYDYMIIYIYVYVYYIYMYMQKKWFNKNVSHIDKIMVDHHVPIFPLLNPVLAPTPGGTTSKAATSLSRVDRLICSGAAGILCSFCAKPSEWGNGMIVKIVDWVGFPHFSAPVSA